MNLRKEINLNKKIIIGMILVNIIILGVYYSYALFEVNTIKNNVIVINTAAINITTEVVGYNNNRVTLNGGESKTLTINLTSNYSNSNTYLLYYKLISGENNIQSSSLTTKGEMNGTITITCVVTNTGNSASTIEIGTKGGIIGYNINVDNDCYKFNQVANVTFDYNDGVTENTTTKKLVGNVYGELPTPTREGYTFLGWSYDNNQYLLLDYIESTGTQYIDTGIIAKGTTGYEIKFIPYNAIGTSNYGSIFGGRVASTDREIQLTTWNNQGGLGNFRYGTGASYDANILVNQVNTISYLGESFISNGNNVTVSRTSFNSGYNITIFALNEANTVTQYGISRLYYIKFYDGNTLIRDYIPVIEKSTERAGLYDKVENVFYGDQNNGNFLVQGNTTTTSIVEHEENHTLVALWKENN